MKHLIIGNGIAGINAAHAAGHRLHECGKTAYGRLWLQPVNPLVFSSMISMTCS